MTIRQSKADKTVLMIGWVLLALLIQLVAVER